MHLCCESTGQLVQLVKALQVGSVSQGLGFHPDLAPIHIMRLLFQPLAISNEAESFTH
jgi:hypothetical protein